MAASTAPIYTRTSDVQNGGLYNSTTIIGPSANTATDGTGANMFAVFRADATEGGFVQKVIFKAVASPAATCIRVWYCSDTSSPFVANTDNTAATTSMVAELTTAAWTASNTLASPQYEVPINFAMPAGTYLLASFGTSTGAAGNGFTTLTIAGKY
jgi:hypothetical protein